MPADPDTRDPLIESTFDLIRRILDPTDGPRLTPYVPAESLAERIDFSLPDAGLEPSAVMSLLAAVAESTPRTASPRFLNQLFGGRDSAAIAGELLAVALNTSMYTFKAAGANALIERELTGAMARLMGFESGEGVFAPGGSMSNFTAIVMARNAAAPAARQKGLDGQPLTLYTSACSHYSITKGAALAGVGRERVRRVSCDARGRMIPDALDAMIRRDRDAGLRPFMINATAGTTVLGAYDPIDSIARIAREHGVWLHVDAALGGSAILSERHRGLLAGVGEADSVTWDAHKMLTVPLTCSVILTRERGLLEQNFDEDAEYLFQADSADVNFGGRALQCGRRNDALKLWASWKRHGSRGLGRRIDRLFDLARRAADLLRDDPEFDLARAPESVNVCFAYRGVGAEAICEELRRTNRLIIGYGEVDGRNVIRAPMVKPDLSDDDMRTMIERVREAGRTLSDRQRPAPAAGVSR